MRRKSIPEVTRAIAAESLKPVKGPPMKLTLPSSKTRQYAYSVVAVALTVLVAYKVIAPEDVPLWLSLAGTVLGVVTTGTAGLATKAQRANGVLPD